MTTTGNDITAPPDKELPPSPEKKAKPLATTQPAKTSTSKAKTQPTSLPKQPAPTTLGGSTKKPMSLASGLAPAAPPKRPAATTGRSSISPSKDAKPKVSSHLSTVQGKVFVSECQVERLLLVPDHETRLVELWKGRVKGAGGWTVSLGAHDAVVPFEGL